MPYTSPRDYTTTLISEADGWIVETHADRQASGSSSGTVRPPMTDETAEVFGIPPEHEARTKYMATLFAQPENAHRYTETFDEAVAFIIDNP